jgi:hypothetical protein
MNRLLTFCTIPEKTPPSQTSDFSDFSVFFSGGQRSRRNGWKESFLPITGRLSCRAMTPDRYEVSPDGRRRLTGILQKRGSRMGLSTGGGFAFGGAFVAAGAAMIIGGAKERNWPLQAAGVFFALGGFWVWSMAWKQSAANRRRAMAAGQYPNETALADYRWHPDGFEVSEWTRLAKAVAIALGLTLFLSMFNWFAFRSNVPWLFKGIVGLFDLIALGTWCQAAVQLGRAFKFGH